MRCLRTLPDGSTNTVNVWWKLFYANCPKINQLCSAQSRAYVPAVTVCVQNLHTGTCDSVVEEC